MNGEVPNVCPIVTCKAGGTVWQKEESEEAIKAINKSFDNAKNMINKAYAKGVPFKKIRIPQLGQGVAELQSPQLKEINDHLQRKLKELSMHTPVIEPIKKTVSNDIFDVQIRSQVVPNAGVSKDQDLGEGSRLLNNILNDTFPENVDPIANGIDCPKIWEFTTAVLKAIDNSKYDDEKKLLILGKLYLRIAQTELDTNNCPSNRLLSNIWNKHYSVKNDTMMF